VGATVKSFQNVSEFLPLAGTMTAVFCVTPATLLELYSRGGLAGLRLGTALAVVAVDSLGVAMNLGPRPTVLQPGIAQLARAVVQSIQQAIQGVVPSDVRLEPVIFDGAAICEVDVPSRNSVPLSPPSTPVSPAPVSSPVIEPIPLEGEASPSRALGWSGAIEPGQSTGFSRKC
jgi:hypothetical protein